MDKETEESIKGGLGLPRGAESKVSVQLPLDNPEVIKEVKEPFLPAMYKLIDKMNVEDQHVVRQFIFKHSGEKFPKSSSELIDKLMSVIRSSLERITDVKSKKVDNKEELLEIFGIFCALYPVYSDNKDG